MTALAVKRTGNPSISVNESGTASVAELFDRTIETLRPSTDAFLESVASTLATIYNSGSEEIVPKRSAFFYAAHFLRSVAETQKPTRVSMDSDGEPVLEWKSGLSRRLTLSFSDDGDISFAGQIAENYIFGNEKFDGTPSETILSLIEQADRPSKTYRREGPDITNH